MFFVRLAAAIGFLIRNWTQAVAQRVIKRNLRWSRSKCVWKFVDM